jgi:hypothetical protein
MSSVPEPFRFLSRDEFAELTMEEKLAYLNMAAEAIMRETPAIGVIAPPRNTLH